MVHLSIFALTVAAATASVVQGMLRHTSHADGFVKSLEFKHRLRVCNAYPYEGALDLFRGRARMTGGQPMPYKTCRDFMEPMKSGDKLEFKVGDASAGTFSVSDLPNSDAVLLLIIHRHDTLSTAVSFESHVFANLLNAQIAVIDTYKGTARATPRIMDAGTPKPPRSEELRYNSVVAVNPGVYEVVLAGQNGEAEAKSELVALNRESYVVMRTGVESQQGAKYPQDLVIFPMSDMKSLKSRASAFIKWQTMLLASTTALTAFSL